MFPPGMFRYVTPRLIIYQDSVLLVASISTKSVVLFSDLQNVTKNFVAITNDCRPFVEEMTAGARPRLLYACLMTYDKETL